MYNSYNLEATSFNSLISIFKRYLVAEKISKGSVRSYLSDLRHFLGWLILFLKANNVLDVRSEKWEAGNEVGSEKIIKSNLSPQYPASHFNLPTSDFLSLLKHVTPRVLEDYKIYLTSNNVPLKTINRRFSSLRRFGEFCLAQNWITENHFDTLRNISLNQPFPENEFHLGEFKNELWKKGSTKLTIKNYLNDVRQFLKWSKPHQF